MNELQVRKADLGRWIASPAGQTAFTDEREGRAATSATAGPTKPEEPTTRSSKG